MPGKTRLMLFMELATERETLKRAISVALLVGIILNLINQPEIFFSFSFHEINIIQIFLTFIVPFAVSTYSSVLSNYTVKPGKVSKLDAILKCKSCKKTDFHVHIGQPIEECPECKEKTRWNPTQIFSSVQTDQELLKSLALFARYNPQPLFRIDEEGGILSANPESENILEQENLVGQKIKAFFPEIEQTNLHELAQKGNRKELIVSLSDNYYNLVLQGVPVLNSIHVYGSDVTEIILAERKIKKQAEEIRSSIHYAWRIQRAMLPENKLVKRIFPEHFIFYQPRDIVSGDFYWVDQVDKYRIAVVADCTGHGVPGAFMSMMGISLLNEIILRENTLEPDRILNKLRERLVLSLKTSNKAEVTDGMDISLIVIDDETSSLTFAGAYNSLYIFRDQELIEIKADHMPVGKFIVDETPFSKKTTTINKGDRLVLFTDGYKDQDGGEKNKKLSSKKFKSLLLNSSSLPVKQQLEALDNNFEEWKGENEQMDDVLVMGIDI